MFTAKKTAKTIRNYQIEFSDVIFIITFLIPISQLIYSIAGYLFNKEALISSFEDDAFYYFKIAQNIAIGLGSTFDGINLTNGYHPLWMFFLTPVYQVFSDKYLALTFIKLITSFFWFLSILILYEISQLLANKIVVLPSLIVLIVFNSLFFKGMETAVLLPVVLLLIYQTIKYKVFSKKFLKNRIIFNIGLLLALIFLARLDSVFVFASYVTYFFFVRLKIVGNFKKALILTLKIILPVCITAIIYLFINQYFFDSLTPVSGQAKSLGIKPFYNLGFITQYFQGIGLKKVAFVFIALLLTFLSRKRLKQEIGESKFKNLCYLCLVFITSLVMQLLYYYLLSTYGIWHWYRYLIIPILIIASIFISYYIVSFSRISGKVLSYSIYFLCFFCIIKFSFYNNIQRFLTVKPDTGHMTSSVTMANWINRELPDNTVLAMGDRAGSLGYQLSEKKSLVQLEGLVNSKDYLNHLKLGIGNQFMQNQNVKYIVVSRSEKQLQGGNNVNRYDVVYEPVTNSVPVPRIYICLNPKNIVHEIKHQSSSEKAEYDVYRVYKYNPELDNSCNLLSKDFNSQLKLD